MRAGLVVSLIKLYQGPLRMALPACCRFHPSCSEYAKQALQKYGLWRGGLKAAKRLMLCHPFSGQSGYNPLE
jgi:putative membrane protein insertion efficiency factor